MALIRHAVPADIPAISGIYAHYVRHSCATFETEPPAPEEMERRRAEIADRGLPYLVVEDETHVIGYGYAGPYRARPAYQFTVEDSLYLDHRYVGKGAGSLLLAALIEACSSVGYRQMIAVIGDTANLASIRVHERFGFVRAGVLQGVGFKLDRWVDTVLMQRALGSGSTSLPIRSTE